MTWKTKHTGLQEHANVDVEDTVVLVDIGGGVPGLPAIDGSQLTGVVAAPSGILCFNRDIVNQVIEDRTTCFMHDPKITGNVTLQGDGVMLVF